MTTLTFEVENPVLYFKDFSSWEFKNDTPEHNFGKRILKEDTFSKINLPNNYFKTIFIDRDWIRSDYSLPIESEWGYEQNKQFEIYLREPHYAYFLNHFEEGLYVDRLGIPLTKEEHYMLVVLFGRGYWNGYEQILNFKQDKEIQSNQQLVHEILDLKLRELAINPHVYNFDFLINNDNFFNKGKILGYNFGLNELIHKIPFAEFPQIINNIQLKTKWKLYLDNYYFHKSVSLSLQSHCEFSIATSNNFFNVMPLIKVYDCFSKLIDESILSIDNYHIFFLKAFVGYVYPKAFFNIKSERDGTKKAIYKLFYTFYQTCIFDQVYEKQLSCKEKYIKLLADNFEGFEFETVKNNFRS